MFDEPSEIGHVLVHAPLAGRSLAPAMAAPIVGNHLELLDQMGDEGHPVLVITPGAVNEDQGVAVWRMLLVVQLHSVYECGGHNGGSVFPKIRTC
jgi:hypothetical protein